MTSVRLANTEYRVMARNLLEWSGLGPVGRPVGDPGYRLVTECREWPGYSSCADNGHWLLFRVGIRCLFVNRAENKGWKVGANVSALAFAPVAQVCHHTDRYAAGDIVIIWNRPDTEDAHVMCVVAHEGDVLTVSEYGQPGGHLATRTLTRNADGNLMCGHRELHRWISLTDAIDYAEKLGELAEPDLSCLDTPTPEGLVT